MRTQEQSSAGQGNGHPVATAEGSKAASTAAGATTQRSSSSSKSAAAAASSSTNTTPPNNKARANEREKVGSLGASSPTATVGRKSDGSAAGSPLSVNTATGSSSNLPSIANVSPSRSPPGSPRPTSTTSSPNSVLSGVSASTSGDARKRSADLLASPQSHTQQQHQHQQYHQQQQHQHYAGQQNSPNATAGSPGRHSGKSPKTAQDTSPSSSHQQRARAYEVSSPGGGGGASPRRGSSPRQQANGAPGNTGLSTRRSSSGRTSVGSTSGSPSSPQAVAQSTRSPSRSPRGGGGRHSGGSLTSPSRQDTSSSGGAAAAADDSGESIDGAHTLVGSLSAGSVDQENSASSASSAMSSSSDIAESSQRGAIAAGIAAATQGSPNNQQYHQQEAQQYHNHAGVEGAEEGDASGELSSNSQHSPVTLSATLSRGAYHQCGTARRVKVYELKGETWFDRGTGYCAGVYDEQNDAALLVARMEETCRRLTLGVDQHQQNGAGESLGGKGEQEEEQIGAEGREDRDHYVLVVSEKLDSDDLLLRARVVKEDVYQRQQDTLVVWTEPDGTDMALSFQEADGCHEVWEFLTEVQKHFMLSARNDRLDLEDGEGMQSGMLGVSNAGMTTDTDLIMSDGSPFALPDPRLDNLHIIEVTLKDAASRAPQAREKVAEWILQEEYLLKLVPTFHDAEELEQIDALHQLCSIMHTLIMLNDNVLVERALRNDVFLGVVGMLEYDPEFPRLKASYRDYLVHTAKFRQVVPIPDPTILTKIHQTFRLQYLKDVILARTLDDSTFAVLNSLIFYHQADIVLFCTTSETFLSSLFQLFERDQNETEEKKAEAIIFLQQLCSVGKQVQLPSRMALYRTLTEWGLLIVLEYALTREEARLRNAAAEILMSIIEYDASGVRAHILDQAEKGRIPLLSRLASILHEEFGDLGLKTQITESLRILFDSGPDGAAGGPVVAQTLAAAAAQAGNDTARKDDNDRFLNWLYEGEVDHLFAPLKALRKYKDTSASASKSSRKSGSGNGPATSPKSTSPENHIAQIPKPPPALIVGPASKSALLNHLCELLTFVMIHHNFRSQYWVISSEISVRLASLLFAREKHLRLSALRFFRACLAKGNQFVNRHFVKIGLLGAILSVVEGESMRDNLVTSACLDFFEHIRKESVKLLINNLMERYESRVRALTHHSAIGHYFQAMILHYEKGAEAGVATSNHAMQQQQQEDVDGSFTSFEAERERRQRDMAMRGEDRGSSDTEEENYFQQEDDDEEQEESGTIEPSSTPLSPTHQQAAASGLAPYAADGEGDVPAGTAKQVEATADVSLESDTSLSRDVESGTSRLSGKRKKREAEEDDDDDMMGRLAKRKSLVSSEEVGPSTDGSQPSSEPAVAGRGDTADATATAAGPQSGEGDRSSGEGSPPAGRRLSINLSSSTAEKIAKGKGEE